MDHNLTKILQIKKLIKFYILQWADYKHDSRRNANINFNIIRTLSAHTNRWQKREKWNQKTHPTSYSSFEKSCHMKATRKINLFESVVKFIVWVKIITIIWWCGRDHSMNNRKIKHLPKNLMHKIDDIYISIWDLYI